MLGACETSGSGGERRSLPPKPSYARGVTVKDPEKGEPAVAVAARERAGRLENQRRLENFGSWYDQVRNGFAGVP